MFFSFSTPICQSFQNQPSYVQTVNSSQIGTEVIEHSESSQPSSQTIEGSESSQPSSQTIEQSQSSRSSNSRKSEEFTKFKRDGSYPLLQCQMCDPNSFSRQKGPFFFKRVPTPFGIVGVLFKRCKNSDRYVRWVNHGGTYENAVKFLNHRIKPKKRKEIFKVLQEYMRFKTEKYSEMKNNLKKCIISIHKGHRSLFNYLENKTSNKKEYKKPKIKKGIYKKIFARSNKVMDTLAKLCAFTSFCDPCYGEGETGGAEIRSAIDKACENGIDDFTFFTDTVAYPFCQKGAYKMVRDHNNGKKINPNLLEINANMSGLHETTEQPETNEMEILDEVLSEIHGSEILKTKQQEDKSDLLEIEISGSDDLKFSGIEPSRN